MIKRWSHIGSCHFLLEGLHVCSLSNTLWEEHPDRIIINGGNSEGIRNWDEIVCFDLCFWLLTIWLAEACLVAVGRVPSDFLNIALCFWHLSKDRTLVGMVPLFSGCLGSVKQKSHPMEHPWKRRRSDSEPQGCVAYKRRPPTKHQKYQQHQHPSLRVPSLLKSTIDYKRRPSSQHQKHQQQYPGSKKGPGTTKDTAGLLLLSLELNQDHTGRCSHKNMLSPLVVSMWNYLIWKAIHVYIDNICSWVLYSFFWELAHESNVECRYDCISKDFCDDLKNVTFEVPFWKPSATRSKAFRLRGMLEKTKIYNEIKKSCLF